MLPLLRKIPRKFQRSVQHRTSSLRLRRQQFLSTRVSIRPLGGLTPRQQHPFRYPYSSKEAAAFTTATDEVEDRKPDPTVSRNSITKREEILSGFLQDLSKVREEVFEVLEASQEQQEKEMEPGISAPDNNRQALRQRYDNAWHGYQSRNKPKSKKKLDWTFSSFGSKRDNNLPSTSILESTSGQAPINDTWFLETSDYARSEADPEVNDLVTNGDSINVFALNPTPDASSSIDDKGILVDINQNGTETTSATKEFDNGGSLDGISYSDTPAVPENTVAEKDESTLPWHNQLLETKEDSFGEDTDTTKEKEYTHLQPSINDDGWNVPKESMIFNAQPTKDLAVEQSPPFATSLETESLAGDDILSFMTPEDDAPTETNFPWSSKDNFRSSTDDLSYDWRLNNGGGTIDGEGEGQLEIKEELAKVCLFLESTKPRDWKLFDADIDADANDESESSWERQLREEVNGTSKSEDQESRFEDGDMDESDPPRSELSDIEGLYSLLDASLLGTNALTTDDFNLVLARVATSPELHMDTIMDNLLEVYHLMKRHAIPDETTYKILLYTLERRISSGSTASDGTIVRLLEDMITFNVALSSGTLLTTGMRCLDRENNLKVAKRLIMEYAYQDSHHAFRVPRSAKRTLMKMLARENAIEDAVSLLEKCTKEFGGNSNGDTDAVLDAALRWPNRNRAGQTRDITHVLQGFLKIIMRKDTKYKPGYSAYRNIIVALARTTKTDPARWELLRAPFHALFTEYETFYPDEFLLRVGLDYGEATKDSELVRTLVLRSVDKHAAPSGASAQQRALFSDLPMESSGFVFDSSWELEGLEGTLQSHAAPNVGSAELDGSIGFPTGFCSLKDTSLKTNAKGSTTFLVEATAGELDQIEVNSSTQPVSFFNSESSGQRSSLSTEMENEMTTTCFDEFAVNERAGNKDTQPLPSAPFSFKVFQKAVKVCLASDDLVSGRDILDALSRVRDQYPNNIESEIWGLALRGYASLGYNADTVMGLFDTMKRKDLTFSEETYGAVINNLAAANRREEASQMFLDLKMASQGGGISPGLSCYNAMVLSHVKSKAWDQVLATYEEMKASGIAPNATTTQSLFIASYRLGGSDRVRQAMEEVLDDNVVISRENCHLALKLLMPDVLNGKAISNVTQLQSRLRDMGAADEALRPACLNLLRSFRHADTEHKRPPTKNAPLEVLAKRREVAWHAALRDILEMDQARKDKESTHKISTFS